MTSASKGPLAPGPQYGALLVIAMAALPASGQCRLSFEALNCRPDPNSYVASRGDYDADGRMDLAARNGSGALTIWRGIGEGWFEQGASYTPDVSNVVASGDWNGDAKVDLAFWGGAKLQVFLGNGNGTFTPLAAVTQTVSGYRPRTVDLNGDGYQDIVSSNSDVYVLLSNGNGTFAPQATYAVGAAVFSVAIADLDADGTPDVVAGRDATEGVGILMGNVDGTLDPVVTYSGASNVYTVAAADFDGNGTADVAVPQQNNGVMVFMGNGDGTLQAPLFQSFPNTSFSVIGAGDLDGDGLADIVFAGIISSKASLCELHGRGDGSFDDPVCQMLNSGSFQPVDVVDLDGDGRLDALVAGLTVALGRGDGTLRDVDRYALPFVPPHALSAADVNGDHITDLVVSSEDYYTYSVFLGKSGGGLDPLAWAAVSSHLYANALSDFDGDGMRDLCITVGGGILILHGNGDGTFATWQAQYGYGGYCVVVGDLNGDGTGDLVTGETYGARAIAVNLDGTLRPAVPLPVTGNLGGITLADVNGDGALDLVVTDQSDASIDVLEGDGKGGFSSPISYAVGAGPRPVAACDLNNDGAPDLLVGNRGESTLSVLMNDGGGGFGPNAFYWSGYQPEWIATADLDGDGNIDVLVTDNLFAPYYAPLAQETRAVAVLKGDGLGGLEYLGSLETGAPIQVLAADLDRNGAPDLAIADRMASLDLAYNTSLGFGPPTLPDATLGVSYTQALIALGGTLPYAFSVLSGQLPPGITLSATGVLDGIPTSAGLFDITVQLVDGNGCRRQAERTLLVAASGCTAPVIVPATLGQAVGGQAYSATLTASGASPINFSIAAGSLPAGLVLSPSGLVSGTPSQVGSYEALVVATDANGCVGSRWYLQRVVCTSISIAPSTLPDGAFGQGYGVTLTASGGTGPYSFSVIGGSLPPGLSLDPGGTISGTPDAVGSFSFTVVAVDGNGCSGSAPYSIVVTCGTVTLDPPGLPAANQWIAYSAVVTGQGGKAPWSYAIQSGALPSGLYLNGSTGVISGTPTTLGSFGFTVRATDVYGCSGSRAYSITVECGTITILPVSLPGAIESIPYTVALSASGGTDPYTFALASGSLPPGLGLSASGVVSGTPWAAGTFSFTVSATDGNGCSGSKVYVLSVGCPVITLSPPSLPWAILGVSYGVTLSASGGSLPYSFSIASGALPPGLSLDAATGVISGAPTSLGSFSLLAEARDGAGCSGTRPYTVDVVLAPDFLLGRGEGQPNPSEVRLYRAAGTATSVDFYAYGAGWGADVAAGSIDLDARDEVLTGPGPGPALGPQIRAFRYSGAALVKVNFYCYGTLKFGANVAARNVDKDAFDEILTGPGPGAVFGPHVRGFNFDGSAVTPIVGISFFAYGTLKYGANVGGGDVDDDGYAEILTGPGPSAVFGATVRAFDHDGAGIRPIGKINFDAYFTKYGVNVAGGDADGDGFDELATGPGPGPLCEADLRAFDYDGTTVAPLPGYDVIAFATLYGARVGQADIMTKGQADLLCGAGPDPSASADVRAYSYEGAALRLLPATPFAPFLPGYGVNVAGGAFGW